jgi:hypothetical protein
MFKASAEKRFWTISERGYEKIYQTVSVADIHNNIDYASLGTKL